MYYRTFKTTMGRKYRMRISDDEKAERELFHLSIVLLPFLGTILLATVWLMRG